MALERDLGNVVLPDDDPDYAHRFHQVKDILNTMANAVSAMKIFPSDHDTVKSFVDSLHRKFDDFFQRYQKLQVGVEEYSFTCGERVVYADEMTIKSLPFFFFKDGTEILYFYRGLDRAELLEFLELIKTVSQKPGGDNDIVAALWESDFSNIQYYAPDEFLENQILAEKKEAQTEENLPELPSDLAHETLEISVDRAKFSEGRIDLGTEDRERLARGLGGEESEECRPETDGTEFSEPAALAVPDESAGVQDVPATSFEPNLSEAEVQELESMVRANRHLWPEEQFINLTAEIIFLEEDPATCAASVDVLQEFHFDQIREGHFPVATAIIRKVVELRSYIGSGAPQKIELLDSCLKKLTGPKTLEAIEATLAMNVSVDWTALLAFFKLLGPPTLPTAANLFEKQADPEVRDQILVFIRETGGPDPALVVSLANDARPALSLEVIGLLADMPNQKGIPHMSAFLMFKNRDIKLETIHALGRLRNEMANRILLGFLNDPDEDLRIQAAMKLNPVEEKSRIVHVIHEASSPEFRKKSLKEKQAILSFLGRTRSEEALTFLSAALGKTTLWPSTRNLEMRLAAVTGLASMGTPEAETALESGASGRGKRVREACAEALARILATIPPKHREKNGNS
jgi:HEAT repeat protein